ncbi:unnamed protein product [Toxocara canis]|uniref:G protein-coupled receptor n=1 Tax=Toxocara canis TaxID=6265 RepID=A0A183UZM3_TOXCA|nr:unnamed protein product [Toxocara canis]
MIVSASIAVSVLSIASIRYSSKFDEIFQQSDVAVFTFNVALLPFFFIILPLVSLFVFALTPISLGVYASVVAILFNWEPCAHPFIALYFVNSFRKRICRFFSALMLHCIFCRNYLNSPVLTKVQPAPQQLRGERLFASSPSSQM